MCPSFDVDVVSVWTNNGKIIIEVAWNETYILSGVIIDDKISNRKRKS
jgi:hypothetical protein